MQPSRSTKAASFEGRVLRRMQPLNWDTARGLWIGTVLGLRLMPFHKSTSTQIEKRACLDALLSRHTFRWSDWLIWPVNHQHRQMVYPISNQYFRPLPKALQRNDSRWKCWANANHSIWRSQVIFCCPFLVKRVLSFASEFLSLSQGVTHCHLLAFLSIAGCKYKNLHT